MAGEDGGDVTPSFVLLAVQENKVICYVYELTKDGEVDVSKTEFVKRRPTQQDSQPVSSNSPALMQSLLS